MVNILILLAILGQAPSQSSHLNIQNSVNRFDEIDVIALDARANELARNNASLSNSLLRAYIMDELSVWVKDKFPHMSGKLYDGETAVLYNIADDAARPYDKEVPKAPVKKETSNLQFPPQTKAWYNTSIGKVWGWKDNIIPNVILYNQYEQPSSQYHLQTPVYQTMHMTGGVCRPGG